MTASRVSDRQWTLRCRDPFDRDRSLTVVLDGDRVLVVPPPGSCAVLSVAETRTLGQALDIVAERAVPPRPDTPVDPTEPAG